MVSKLEVIDLHASVGGKKILNGLNLSVAQGEIHVIMGPNGAGKTTLANVIMGSPSCIVESGSILLDSKDITKLKPDERAKLGLFLAFQHPIEVPGVRVFNFLRTAYKHLHGDDISLDEFEKNLKNKLKQLRMPESFIDRYLNEGFSGGEKKRFEVLQMLVLRPKIAIMDETDSGLDIDTLKIVAKSIMSVASETGVLYITHYDRVLKYLKPNFVHVLIDGKIVRSGDIELAKLIEEHGYSYFKRDGEN
jgi:Fe-S cluster assembly ATP-binding protein